MGPKIVIPGKVIRVIDSDSIVVNVTFELTVRLLDCYAPELKSKVKEEKELALAGKRYLYSVLFKEKVGDWPEGKEVLIEIPFPYNGRISDLFTFGRILGNLYLGDLCLSGDLVEKGYAKNVNTK